MAQHKIIDRYEVVVEDNDGKIIARAIRGSLGGDWVVTQYVSPGHQQLIATIYADRTPEVLQRKLVLSILSTFEEEE